MRRRKQYSRKFLPIVGSAIILLSTFSCHEHALAPPESSPFVYVPPYAWTSIRADSVGIDTSLLRQGLNSLKSLPYVFSTLVLRDSFLVAEYYPSFLTKLNDYDIRSASKSFISALIGIALHQGLIEVGS